MELTSIGKSPEQLKRESTYGRHHKEVLKKREDENMRTIIWLNNALNGIATPGDKRGIKDPHEISAAKKYLKSIGINCGS